MKKFLSFLFVAALVTGCGSVAPDAGHESVLIEKPLFFGHGGVAQTPVRTGRQFVAFTTQDVDVNMQPETYHLNIDDMMSADGVPLDFNSTIRLQVTDSVKLVTNFGPKWYENNVQQPFFQAIRNAVKKHGMNETAISTAASDQIDNEVTTEIASYLTEKGLPVRLIDVTVGKANPPDSVKHQRIETATQEQRINTEKQRKLAEDIRKSAETSRAEADNAYRTSMQLNPEQFLQLESIKAMRDVCGTGHCSIVTTGALPTFGIKP